ncbi:MAG TPA: hypothetical protein VF458_02910 [Ktedonobacteraceae bacterium]
MEAHHLRVIERLKEKFQDDPRYLALIVDGSLVKGRGQVNSDVDIQLVASAEEYARCVEKGEFWYYDAEICDYPGGYVDGKIIDVQFLRDAAHHGSEPARAAFVGAFLAFSHLPELDNLLKQIPVYQDSEREAKMQAFYGQVQMLNWYVKDAEKRDQLYLRAHATSEMVFYAARLVLAYNHILYPYHKWLMYEVERAPEKPENFLSLAETLLKDGSAANADALWQCIDQYRDWGLTWSQALVLFMKESEWNWREGRAPLADW